MTDGAQPMDEARWARLERLFHEATELPSAEVAAFLDEACSDDPELRARVAGLVEADTATGAVVDQDVVSVASSLVDGASSGGSLAPGSMLGRYRVLEPIGVGGMGTVYRAERADGAFEQTVALKVMNRGRLDGSAASRFRREREILARLSHPGIATLLDGGVAESGRPYLVMELVQGRSITAFADERALGVRDRVELLLHVVEGVEYAHRNLVVHRDLKPSNILVDGSGRVKLLDFGIARLVPEEGVAARETRTGVMLLTPAYAAPEQIRGESATTAVDVYAMGAVLYELLSGRRPHGDPGSTWADLQRVLEHPPSPMSAVPDLDRSARRALEGDLDTIVSKAMHKDPARRYASAGAFGDDLRRYLGGRPVLARPDSLGYRLSKLVRRNVAASWASAAVVLAVGLGVGGTWWQARAAQVEAERRDAVSDFIVSVFEGADPERTPGEPVTALELLEAGLLRIDALDAGPEVRVDLLVVLGELFDRLGHFERAEGVLRQAVLESESSLPRGDRGRGDALDALGRHVISVGDPEEAERLLRSALEARESDGSAAEELAATEANLALAIRMAGRFEEAEERYRALISQSLEAGADSVSLVSELLGLGQSLQFQGRRSEAIEVFEAARRLKVERGERDSSHAQVTHALGVVLAEEERYDDAVAAHEAVLEYWSVVYPEGHPEVAGSLEAIGRVRARQGNWSAADSVYDAAIETWSSLYGDDHGKIATIRANQANLRYFEGDFDAARAAYTDAIRVLRAGAEPALLASAVRNLASIERERGDYASADTLLAEALDLRLDLFGPSSDMVAEVHSSYAVLWNLEGRHADAAVSAEAALSIYEDVLDTDHRLTLNARLQLARAWVEEGRFDDAAGVLAPLHALFTERLNPADAQLGRSGLWLGVSLAALGDADEARARIEAALPILEQGLGVDAPESVRARTELSRLGG